MTHDAKEEKWLDDGGKYAKWPGGILVDPLNQILKKWSKKSIYTCVYVGLKQRKR